MDLNEETEKAYQTPSHPASFSGADKLYRALRYKGISKGAIKRWLQSRDDYTLHRRQFPRQRVIVGSIDQQWDADLVYMTFASDNEGYKFILVCIDILSHYLWTRPLHSKQGKEVKEAFRDILRD